MIFPKIAIYAIASGFSEAQIQATIPLSTYFNAFYILFINKSLFTGALHSADHFLFLHFTIILNIFLLRPHHVPYRGYSVDYLCFL